MDEDQKIDPYQIRQKWNSSLAIIKKKLFQIILMAYTRKHGNK